MRDVINELSLSPMPPGTFIGRTTRPTAGPVITVRSPIDGRSLAAVKASEPADVAAAVQAAHAAFLQWRLVPAPRRGELVRRLGEKLRASKNRLARLVTLETGKILPEAQGEVQEMIDMCDFAVGLSRQLYGLTMPSERPAHRLMEQWHPLGVVGVITAFNFPVAVWAWNAAIALVCGDSLIWKPSEKTPLCAIACHNIAQEIADAIPEAPDGLLNLVIGDARTGQALAASEQVPLVSATGSVRMGREIAPVVAGRLGRTLLELGGNNAMVVAPSADLDLAVRAIVFAAVGTAGQRCTTLRRLIVHESIQAALVERLAKAFASLPVGDPSKSGTLVGPLIDAGALKSMEKALEQAMKEGGRIVCGGQRITKGVPEGGVYVRPALVQIPPGAPVTLEETFAPILYLMPYRELDEAIALHNAVPQGLSSAIFTRDLREAEIFLSAAGSDCGIVNVNIGTSGAEIGGAFGGEKQTGGGRESGSDAWKAYMRRVTNTINYSTDLPLAQGIEFDPDK